MIELIDICFERDNKKILNNINLKLDKNKFYVITGQNGSGKSTLVKIIMGIIKPDSGKILLDGEDITNLPINERANAGIGFAFQQPVIFKGITVYDLLSFASNKQINKKEACDILSKVGLCALEYIDREVNKSLSGGELKRIEIATVLARKPRIAIFDEPEAGIDLWSFRNLNKIFKQISEDNNSMTLVISHQEKILNMADKIILMENGNIVNFDTCENVMDSIISKPCCKKEEIYNG
jgi:Fe-S cluster assembly ATP-binding protein